MRNFCFILMILLGVPPIGCERQSTRATASPWSASSTPIRLVSYNVQWNQAGPDRIIDAIRDVHPDVVLLAEVPPADLKRMADRLGEITGGKFNVYGTPN